MTLKKNKLTPHVVKQTFFVVFMQFIFILIQLFSQIFQHVLTGSNLTPTLPTKEVDNMKQKFQKKWREF